jgi:hypothetical protein
MHQTFFAAAQRDSSALAVSFSVYGTFKSILMGMQLFIVRQFSVQVAQQLAEFASTRARTVKSNRDIG